MAAIWNADSGFTIQGTFTDNWIERLKTAADSDDLPTVRKLMLSTLSPIVELNPIRMVEYNKDRRIIPLIIQVMRRTERLDDLAIAQRLIRCHCEIKHVVNATDVDVALYMIHLGAPVAPEGPAAKRSTALHEAVKHGDTHLRLVELLLERGAYVNGLDHTKNTPLLRCLDAPDSIKTLRLLVSRGARADVKGGRSRESLFRALNAGQPLEAVKLLVRVGANIRASGRSGLTAVQYAAAKQRGDVVEYLLDLDDAPTSHERNILHLAFDAPVEYLRYVLLVCGFRIYSETIANKMCTVMRSFYDASRAKREEAARNLRFSIACGLDVTFWHKRQSISVDDDMWVDALVEQVAVREFLDLEVDEECRDVIYESDIYLSHVVACKYELAALMELRFYGDLTIFNILTDDDARMRRYVQNEELVAAFRRVCEEEVFLIYRDLVIERFDNFLYVHEIRKKALRVLGRTMHGVLDGVIVREIAKYLSMRDLFKFSKFCEE